MPIKILVTGGAGFIGSHTAEQLLARGDNVVVVDEMNDYYDLSQKEENLRILSRQALRSKCTFRFYKADVSDRAAMGRIFEEEHFDVVIHLAARAGVRPSIADPFLYVQSNVMGTTTLLDLSHKHAIKNFIYASSSSVYGGNTKVPFAESDPTEHPISPYAATKKACELMASTFAHLYGLNVTGLRFFTVYGPRGRPDMAPFMFMRRVSLGIPIDRFGDGTSSRDYTFIDDIVSGVLAAVDRPHKCAVFNLGNSNTVTLGRFIRVVEESVGRRAVINVKPDQPGDVKTTFADLTLSEAELGYQPRVSIEEGMRRLAEWFAEREATMEGVLESATVVDSMPILMKKLAAEGDATAAAVVAVDCPPSPPLSSASTQAGGDTDSDYGSDITN
ncbi:hypothetical protein HK101_005420 [Irineochytrium annulatum]|nr:hypothetical protein HK101_005420 [Irineochytrium annulatum]